ncbi:MAG TPA: EamA family transporter [Candidatus Paceibacterota bacterium]|nr:EamA family transporter [Candidatus Paceibacterota bacterium]
MTWFLIALIGPFLYAITNHIDKILLEKYFKEGGVGTLIIFSAVLSALALPFLFIADPSAFSMSLSNIAILTVVGILNVLVLLFYLLALKDEEASIAIVFYQLVPVFGVILGYIFLDEVLTQMQLLAMGIVILGTSIVSFEIDADNRFRLRRSTILYMSLAGFFWALESVIFKMVALEENVVRSLFWEHLMLTVVGILIFIFIRSYRTHFLEAVRVNSRGILGLNVANEAIYMVGNIVTGFAYLLAPIGLILLGESYQPLFVFAIGIFLTIFFPKIVAEKIEAKHLWPKIFAIVITGIGTYLLLLST